MIKIRFLLLTILIYLTNQTLFCFQKTPIGLGLAGVAAFAWGYNNYYKKLKLENYFNEVYTQHKMLTAKLQSELQSIRDEKSQQDKETMHLATLSTTLEKIEIDYKDEFALLKEHNREHMQKLLALMHERMTKQKERYSKNLEIYKETLTRAKYELEVKALQWVTKEYGQSNVIYSQKLTNRITQILSMCSLLLSIAQKYELQLDFAHFIDRLKKNYDFEAGLESENYQDSLDTYIRSLYADVEFQFPYVTYNETLKNYREALESKLEKISESPLLIKEEYVLEAQKLAKLFHKLAQFISTSPKFEEQKKLKPIYELQCEKKAFELQSKRTLITKETMECELQLQKELNQTKLIENQKLEIERSIKELYIKERELELEWAQLKETCSREKLLEDTSHLWQDRCEKLFAQKDESEKNLKQLQGQFSTLKYQIREALQAIELCMKEKSKNNEQQMEKIQSFIHTFRNNFLNEVR